MASGISMSVLVCKYLSSSWRNENHELGTGFFVYKRMKSAVKRAEFDSNRMLHNIKRSLV